MFNPLTKPGFLIRRLQQVSVRLFQNAMGNIDLTSVQYVAMQVIQNRPGIDQVSLSQATDIDRTTIVRLLDRLRDQGRIEKVVNVADRRMNRLYLTETGAQLLAVVLERAEASQKELLSPLSEQERKTFMALAAKLVVAHADSGSVTAQLMEGRWANKGMTAK
jgi:DNA-binding MarR family transcriptional regulator